MTRRDVVRLVLEGGRPPYVPWSFGFTKKATLRLQAHLGVEDLETAVQNHFLKLGSDIGFFRDIGDECVQDVFGVVWDRSVDKDIGIIKGCVLPEASLKGYAFPDPLDQRFFGDISDRIARYGNRLRVFQIGFSLYERAWTLRGLMTLLMDFYDHPGFVRDLLNAIADYNMAQIGEALKYDIDAVYFGDDWGQQRGLQMGPVLWREFIRPVLQRMYGEVRRAGRYVMIHSCGDVDELFDDLLAIGVNCFNPFQPEVMDVETLIIKYRGRWTFHGGLSTQKTLAYGTPEDVRREAHRLIDLGKEGGYIFAPAHDVQGDVSLENMLAFIEVAKGQEGYLAG
ncbi:MAG TPA: uroporphyrinogen decarboxylase family protein [Anaerolineales bacterium]|nr:uroporphyrinogen decarboxylase family protein [Anaerolineales bacterium]